MDSRFPHTSSSKPHTQESDGHTRQTEQQQLSSLVSRTSESDSLNVSEGTSSRRTSSLSVSRQDQSQVAKEMHSHRSSTPPGGSSSSSVKYTRTGRVSKAAKGQRIHHCEECQKTFSRAEHLRRHQQNHRPGAFRCDFQGCTLTFAREDLLMRHKARHSDLNEGPSGRQLLGGHKSRTDEGALHALPEASRDEAYGSIETTTPSQLNHGSDAQQSDMSASRPPKRLPIPPNELSMARLPVATSGPFAGIAYNPWNDSPPPVPSAYDYDSSDEVFGMPYFQDQTVIARDLSTVAFPGYDMSICSSRSPTSDGSSTMNAHWSVLPIPGYGIAAGQDGLACAALSPSFAGAMTACTRDAVEQQKGLFDAVLDPEGLSSEQRYIDAYFAWTHDQLPIIHKPSFLLKPREDSPLLRTAILALGGQALGRSLDIPNAQILYEKCVQVLKRRTAQGTHTYCVGDMQAIVLVEMYSMFNSRNPSAGLSKDFEDVYCILSNDLEAIQPLSRGVSTMGLSDDYTASSLQMVEALCKQRLLLACYMLSHQNTSLFGTSPSISLPQNTLDLPFPASQTQWDSPFPIDHPSANLNNLFEALTAVTCMTSPTKDYHDAFRSLLLISALSDPSSGLNSQNFPLLLTIEPSPRVTLAFHTMMLCKNTPVRDLLAVVSASSTDKQSLQAELSASQIEIRDWVTGQAGEDVCVHAALSHAFSILKIHRKHSRTGLLFQEWAVFLAAVAIWAQVHVVGKDRSASDDLLKSNGVEKTVDELLGAGSVADMGPRDARNILLWVKSKLELAGSSQSQGLVCKALNVLRKLVSRTEEDN